MNARGVAAVAVAAVLALGGCDIPVVGGGSSDSSARPEPSAAVSGDKALGPNGYQKLTLGMSKDEALATGLITVTSEGDGTSCVKFDLTSHPPGLSGVGGYILPSYGVIAIFAADGMRTPEDAGSGTMLGTLQRLYPQIRQVSEGSEEWRAPVPQNPERADYVFVVKHGLVSWFGLTAAGQNCPK